MHLFYTIRGTSVCCRRSCSTWLERGSGGAVIRDRNVSKSRSKQAAEAGRMLQTLHHRQQRSYWELRCTCSFMRRGVAVLGCATSCLPVAGCSIRLLVHLLSCYLRGSFVFQENVFIGTSWGSLMRPRTRWETL